MMTDAGLVQLAAITVGALVEKRASEGREEFLVTPSGLSIAAATINGNCIECGRRVTEGRDVYLAPSFVGIWHHLECLPKDILEFIAQQGAPPTSYTSPPINTPSRFFGPLPPKRKDGLMQPPDLPFIVRPLDLTPAEWPEDETPKPKPPMLELAPALPPVEIEEKDRPAWFPLGQVFDRYDNESDDAGPMSAVNFRPTREGDYFIAGSFDEMPPEPVIVRHDEDWIPDDLPRVIVAPVPATSENVPNWFPTGQIFATYAIAKEDVGPMVASAYRPAMDGDYFILGSNGGIPNEPQIMLHDWGGPPDIPRVIVVPVTTAPPNDSSVAPASSQEPVNEPAPSGKFPDWFPWGQIFDKYGSRTNEAGPMEPVDYAVPMRGDFFICDSKNRLPEIPKILLCTYNDIATPRVIVRPASPSTLTRGFQKAMKRKKREKREKRAPKEVSSVW